MTSAPGNARQRYSTLLWRLVSSSQWERALGVAGEGLAEEPEASEAHVAAGQALVNLRRHEEAVVHLQRALTANPGNAFAHRLTSITYFHLGLYPRADHHIMEAIRLQPRDAMHWYHLALMGYKHRHFDAAAGYARRSLELAPNHADAINLLALCERKNSAQRLDHYKRALSLDPENAVVHNNLGVYHLNVDHDKTRAAECFRRALSINPADEDAQRNLVLSYRLGDPLYRVLHFPKALFAVCSFKPGVYSVRTAIWLGLCVVTGGTPLLFFLGMYGCWLAGGLPLLKAYEVITLPDLRERAGIPGARRGGPLRFWRWPRFVRILLLLAAYGACFFGAVHLAHWVGFANVLVGAVALGVMVTLVNAGRAGWKVLQSGWRRRQLEKKWRTAAAPTPISPL